MSSSRQHTDSVRRLAAIMFTDIVGFSALMGSDEQKTFEILEKNRQIHKPIIEEYHGRWIKEMGDGVMATFNTVSDAVHAAMKIMESCIAANEYQLSIGIHSAEVVFENNDVFGDGINIASRIETLGIPGSILLSKNVRDQLINKTEFQLASLGSFELKNISEPMEIFALANPGFVVPRREEIQGKLERVEKKSGILKLVAAAMLIFISAFAIWFFNKDDKIEMPVYENSIAVLPFVNMSDDKEQEYFSDGISEEIINALAQVSELKVIGRTSSFAFKGQNQDLKTIGDQLNVGHILEGSVRKSGNTLRITAQLIKVSDGFHLYSKTFDKELKDVFAIQDEISAAVLDAVKIKLLKKVKAEFFKKYTENVEAYQQYLQGLYYQNRMEFSKAIEFYKSAIKIDDRYAIAYAQMSRCFGDLQYFGIDSDENLKRCKEAADRAIELDDHNAEGYISKGRTLFWNEREFTTALKFLKKGILISPNNAEGLRQLGALQMFLGNFEEGHRYLDKVTQLDPVSLIGLVYTGYYYLWEKDFYKMREYAERALAIEPKFPHAHMLLGFAYYALNHKEKAITIIESTAEIYSDIIVLSQLACIYAATGKVDLAKRLLDKMHDLIAGEKFANSLIARVYLAMNQVDQALEYMEWAAIKQEGDLLWFNPWIEIMCPDLSGNMKIKRFLERNRLLN